MSLRPGSEPPPALDRWVRPLESLLGAVTVVVLFAMMALTCVDVAGRYFFNMPVHGGLELTELLLAATIFCAFPLVTLRDEHVAVDLLDAVTPDWLLRIQHVAACLVGSGALSIIGWRLFLRGERLQQAGETTNVLKIPLAPVAYVMAGFMVFTAVMLLIMALRRPKRAHQAQGGIDG